MELEYLLHQPRYGKANISKCSLLASHSLNGSNQYVVMLIISLTVAHSLPNEAKGLLPLIDDT